MLSSPWSNEGVSVTADNLSGTAELVGLRAVGGIECLEIQATMTIEGAELPALAPGARLLESRMKMTMNALFPTGPEAPRQASSEWFVATFIVAMPDGAHQMAIEMKNGREYRLEQLPGSG